MTTIKNNTGNNKNKLIMVIFFAVFVFLIFGSTGQISADTCKDLGIHYGSSSFCPTQSKKQPSSATAQSTVLRLFDMRNPFNEGDPVVFVGKLSTDGGIPVRGAKITITHDGTCINKTIGYGITDKSGRFWILTTAKVWDQKDNLIKARAEFSGQKGLRNAVSESKIIVVYPVQNKLC